MRNLAYIGNIRTLFESRGRIALKAAQSEAPKSGGGSIVKMIRGCTDPEPLHLVEERGAFQAESCGGAARTAEFPIGTLAGGEYFLAHFVFERRIGYFDVHRFVSFGRIGFEDAIGGEDDAACDVVLEFANVAWPGVENQGTHDFVGD